MKKLITYTILFFCLMTFQSCFLTKIVTVPMRIVGAATSIVPKVGDMAHDAIDEAADVVDEVPI